MSFQVFRTNPDKHWLRKAKKTIETKVEVTKPDPIVIEEELKDNKIVVNEKGFYNFIKYCSLTLIIVLIIVYIIIIYINFPVIIFQKSK